MTNTLGVVKVGYSTNDPDERVKDWASATGTPGTAKVEYAVWVEGPEIIERKVHERLTNYREKNKEWFKCDLATAVKALHKFGPFIHVDDQAGIRKRIELKELEHRREEESKENIEAIRENIKFARQAVKNKARGFDPPAFANPPAEKR
ncbi:GIY-YIG nuclease family protein [Gammaproteobacteria bacterium]|nr:GIY-YIG nuclease family protein [Gammaproteobacteria bacterium]